MKIYNNIKNFYFKKITINANTVITRLYITLVILLFYNPFSEKINGISSFDRIIGNGILQGMDIEKRINHAYFFYLIIFPLLFIGIFSIFNYLYVKYRNSGKDTEKAFSFLYTLSLASFFT